MATIRKGNHAVLLIVDVQVGVVEGAWEVDRIIQGRRSNFILFNGISNMHNCAIQEVLIIKPSRQTFQQMFIRIDY